MQLELTDRAGKTGPALTGHQPRLQHLLRGPSGLEVSLAKKTLPPALLEVNELLRSGRREEARIRLNARVLQSIQDRISEDPGCTDIMYVTARLSWETGQAEVAERFLRMVLDREEHPVALADLARLIQQDTTRSSEAGTYWRRAWELAPDNLECLLAYAAAVRDLGDVQRSVKLLEQAARQAPQHCGVASQLLWNYNYLPGYDRVDLYARAKQWAEKHLASITRFTSYDNEPSPTKKLRVGLVSGDFLENSPLMFFAPALAMVNRHAFSLHAYSTVSTSDAGTGQYVALFDGFRDVQAMTDPEMATQIRQDGIDILVAFGGRCQGNRLGVMALQPAPVQVDWGALATLGFPQIGYRITDEVLDPPDSQPYHTEALVYLSGGYTSYQPPPESPVVTPPPAQTNGHFTFGSFNNHLKITDQLLDMWEQVLQRVPRSQLVLKFPSARDRGVREFTLQRLAQRGIDCGRIKLCGPTEYYDHLCLLGQVDILLDAYPFNGFRTTLEGLWMGVPTITLSGTQRVSRTGLAIMKQLGLDGAFVAHTPQAYIDRACAYADQLDALAQLRRGLREVLLSSPICDPQRFARALQGAFRYMWQQWCAGQADVGRQKLEVRR